MWNFLALVLITVGTPENAPIITLFPSMNEAIFRQAVAMELFDPRDTHIDCLSIARQRRDILINAPTVGEGRWLPNTDTILANRQFNREFYNHIEASMMGYPHKRELLDQVLKETDRLYTILEHMYDAARPSYYITTRRRSLFLLKEAMGERDFNENKIPPHIPIWRFSEIK